MKRNLIGILTTLALSLSISVPSTSAQTATKATVPFAFTVGQTEMPAGTYTISPVSQSAIMIRDSNTAKAVLSLVRSEQANSSDGTSKLVFQKYGNKYFLSQVSRGFGRAVMQLPTSKLEKEMRIASTRGVSEQNAVVAAK
jgi:hypothetical protein